jgi:hypothetical protein
MRAAHERAECGNFSIPARIRVHCSQRLGEPLGNLLWVPEYAN